MYIEAVGRSTSPQMRAPTVRISDVNKMIFMLFCFFFFFGF